MWCFIAFLAGYLLCFFGHDWLVKKIMMRSKQRDAGKQ